MLKYLSFVLVLQVLLVVFVSTIVTFIELVDSISRDVSLVSANPITTPSVDIVKCTTKSYNIQFQYEIEQELECQLQREYGNVNTLLLHALNCYIYVIIHGIGTKLCSASGKVYFRNGGEVQWKTWQCCQLWLWNWNHIFPTLKEL